MLRLTELKLPLNHAPEALAPALCTRLDIEPGELIGFTIHKRSHDARKKSAIVLIYQIDFQLANEAAYLMARGAGISILLIALGVLGGVLVFGFIGIFLGPVLLALGQMLLTRWLREET